MESLTSCCHNSNILFCLRMPYSMDDSVVIASNLLPTRGIVPSRGMLSEICGRTFYHPHLEVYDNNVVVTSVYVKV